MNSYKGIIGLTVAQASLSIWGLFAGRVRFPLYFSFLELLSQVSIPGHAPMGYNGWQVFVGDTSMRRGP